SGNIANWTGESNASKIPSATNPIVGRIAFWTDDESCKVNINTASEGTYWDVPRIYSDEDFGVFDGSKTGMAIYQPAKREYQRYPGHPATTCLSPIFGSLLPVTFPYPIAATSVDAVKLDPYYALTPRVGLANAGGSGGSKGGSFASQSLAAMTVDSDRLYASVDELIFASTRTQNASGKITKDELDKRRFFLTASSSAPETTLFNTPRISIWPVHVSPAKCTVFDKLLAFCSTIGGKPFNFTRSNARSSTEDYTARNAVLYQYLQKYTSANIPGFGGNFSDKFTDKTSGLSDRDQILTSIFDYIRCVNLSDTSNGATLFTPKFDASNVVADNTSFYASIRGAGEVVPIKIGNTRGFGRCYGVSAAALVFYGTHATGANTDRMQAVFMLEFACPMQGMAGMLSNLSFKMTGSGLEKFMAAPKATTPAYATLGFPAGGTNYIENADASTWAGRSVGGSEGPGMGLTNGWSSTKKIATGFAPGAPGTALKGTYPFVTGQDFVFTTPTPAFLFKGGDLTMEIRTADTNELLQTLHFTFPDGEFKTPGVDGSYSNFNSRLAVGGLGGGDFIKGSDTVVSLETAGIMGNAKDDKIDPTAGDTRMIAALADIPASRFRPHKNYSTPGVQWAHGLRFATGQPYAGTINGKLVAVSTYNGNSVNPEVPSRVGEFVTRTDSKPGDWDTGIGEEKDGAYLNKPDEGDTARWGSHVPYNLGNPAQFQPSGDTYFSPNRQMPSSMMFGSIPTGVQRFQPWQTLSFHPRPEDPNHPGNQSPKDHLLADLFWMPVVEPYAISQPFSTSGKINLNYQIAPFTYINRSTGIHAVMRSTRFLALQLADGPIYKPRDPSWGASSIPNRRRYIDMAKTLVAFDEKFKSNDLFRSASQICEINLVPPEVTPSAPTVAATNTAMATFWNNNPLTGDNVREKPYVDIYPRLTTKSNVYTVHFRVQVLKKVRATDATKWDETKDLILSENRGSSIIERYVDAADTTLPDFATDSTKSLDAYYKFRVLSTKKF
ncbi:MAG: Verru_Chthon cassette protein A, partial [Verrucomicrobiaceae bacterium]